VTLLPTSPTVDLLGQGEAVRGGLLRAPALSSSGGGGGGGEGGSTTRAVQGGDRDLSGCDVGVSGRELGGGAGMPAGEVVSGLGVDQGCGSLGDVDPCQQVAQVGDRATRVGQ
jgi:hypothetical protein